MLYKTVPAKITTAKEDQPEGSFEAIVSVFGNVDYMGDRVLKGAFTGTLKEWGDSGDPIPVIWSHQADDPNMHLGRVMEAKETDEGLWVKGLLDLDHPKAARVFRLMKERRVKQFSFAYNVLDSEEKDGVNELKALKVHEVGPTPIGANPATQLLDVKHRKDETIELGSLDDEEEKANVALTTQTAAGLAEAFAKISKVFAALAGAEDEEEEPSEEPKPKPDQQPPAAAARPVDPAVKAALADLAALKP